MAPHTRKRKSEAMDETPQPHTPTHSENPTTKRMKITASQKQALIDNLQLEITERARHLRAHYALQCADLRSRVERRVNRIPMALRKVTMGELVSKYAQASQPPPMPQPARIRSDTNKTLPPLPHEQPTKSLSPIKPDIQAPVGRGKKRKSSEIQIASDKENDFASASETLPVAKKTRGKATTAAGTRAVSRTAKPVNVLSPRSHNSRTLPRSPIKGNEPTSPVKPASPTKSFIARPISPLKPASPLKSAASAATSAISAAAHGVMEHAKRGAANAGKLSRTASREKPEPAALAATTTAAGPKGRMLPPPRPVPSASASPQRAASNSSTLTSASDISTTSTTTTVVTKPKRGGRVTKTTTTAKTSPVAAKPATTKTTATIPKAGGALKSNAKGANKKVVVAEPAAGRRVLRKRD